MNPTNINVGPRIAALRMRSLPSSGGGRCEIRIVEFEDLMIEVIGSTEQALNLQSEVRLLGGGPTIANDEHDSMLVGQLDEPLHDRTPVRQSVEVHHHARSQSDIEQGVPTFGLIRCQRRTNLIDAGIRVRRRPPNPPSLNHGDPNTNGDGTANCDHVRDEEGRFVALETGGDDPRRESGPNRQQHPRTCGPTEADTLLHGLRSPTRHERSPVLHITWPRCRPSITAQRCGSVFDSGPS